MAGLMCIRRSFFYDGSDRPTRERWHVPADDRVVRTNSFTCDHLDRLTSASDPDAALHWACGLPCLVPGKRGGPLVAGEHGHHD